MRVSEEGDRPHVSAGPATLIDISGVTKWFSTKSGDVQALAEVNLAIGQGEFVSIVGPSGCGKSTLLSVVSGLVPPSTGGVTIGGSGVTKPYTDLGFVFQQDVLLDWRSVLRNVLLQCEVRGIGKAQAQADAMRLLMAVGLGDFAHKRPYELSGGMRQRVAICRALVHDPPLLLLDEPFGALDAITRDQLNVDMQRLWLGTSKTAIMVTHSIPEAVFLADRVIVMSPRPGRVEEVLTIDLPRPRPLAVRETPEFGAYVREIRAVFLRGGVLVEG